MSDVFNVYALLDIVAGTFSSVTVDLSDDLAKRNFASAVSRSAELQFIAKDLSLYRLGTVNIHTGVLSPESAIVFLCRGSEVIANE